MDSVIELKAEIEEIRILLNTIITGKGSSDCDYKVLLDISTKMDTLILEYIKNAG